MVSAVHLRRNRRGTRVGVRPQPVVEARALTTAYDTGKVRVEALRGVDLDVSRGDVVAIMGPSGCGKATSSPYSPKLNGYVERANRTFRDDFYNGSTSEPTVAGFTGDLRTAEDIYHTIRPHQALGYRTPLEYLDAWHTTQEEVSRTS